MQTPYEAEDVLPEIFREIRAALRDCAPFPAATAWVLRAELPPGYGIVGLAETLIFTPLG